MPLSLCHLHSCSPWYSMDLHPAPLKSQIILHWQRLFWTDSSLELQTWRRSPKNQINAPKLGMALIGQNLFKHWCMVTEEMRRCIHDRNDVNVQDVSTLLVFSRKVDFRHLVEETISKGFFMGIDALRYARLWLSILFTEDDNLTIVYLHGR